MIFWHFHILVYDVQILSPYNLPHFSEYTLILDPEICVLSQGLGRISYICSIVISLQYHFSVAVVFYFLLAY